MFLVLNPETYNHPRTRDTIPLWFVEINGIEIEIFTTKGAYYGLKKIMIFSKTKLEHASYCYQFELGEEANAEMFKKLIGLVLEVFINWNSNLLELHKEAGNYVH